MGIGVAFVIITGKLNLTITCPLAALMALAIKYEWNPGLTVVLLLMAVIGLMHGLEPGPDRGCHALRPAFAGHRTTKQQSQTREGWIHFFMARLFYLVSLVSLLRFSFS